MSTYYNTTCHLRLKMNGNVQKIEAFNYIAGLLDADFPYAPHAIRRVRPAELMSVNPCGKCGGRLWTQPSYGVTELLALATQIAKTDLLPGFLKLKVKSRVDARKCEEIEGGV